MPKEIPWSGREAANWRSFKIGVKHVHNDERPGNSSALFDDPEGIAAV